MLTTWIGATLARDLRALRREVEAYADERDLWRVPKGIANSAGNLALHLVGNLRQFVGAVLGGDGYVRNRDAEFSSRDVPRPALLREIDAAISAVQQGMARVKESDLARPFPMPVGGHTVATGDFLNHLMAHFGYHLGQIDYHRRIVTGAPAPVGTMAIPELATAKPVAKS
ncbi:MAG TPA: DUF1572 family protein [Gemmatimonadales bacterium]